MDSRHPPEGRLALGIALAAFLVALIARALWIAEVQAPWDAVRSDMAFYLARARAPLIGETIEGACYPFGTHMLYRAEMVVFGVDAYRWMAALHAVMGAAVAAFTSLLAARMSPWPAVWAVSGLAVALWPPLLAYVGYFSSELPFSLGLVAAAWAWVRFLQTGRHGWLAGLITGLAFTLRPPILLLVPPVLLYAVLRQPRPTGRALVLAIVPLALILMGSAGYHHAAVGRWGWISTNGEVGRFFAETSYNRIGAWRPLTRDERIAVAEASLADAPWPIPPHDRYIYYFTPGSRMPELGFEGTYVFPGDKCDPQGRLDRERRRVIAQHGPLYRLWAWRRNIWLLAWDRSPWPERKYWAEPAWRRGLSESSNAFVRYVLSQIAAVGAALLAYKRSDAAAVAAFACLAVLVSAALYAGESRYRIPFDPFLWLLAVYAVVGWFGGTRTERHLAMLWGLVLVGVGGLALLPWPATGWW